MKGRQGPFCPKLPLFDGRARSDGTGISMLNRLHLCCRRLLAPLWASLALAGCATSPGLVAPSSAPVPARLAVVNLTPHVWRIAVSAPSGGEPRVWQVEGHATVELELPAGVYRIEQTLLTAPGQGGATRVFPAVFEAGQAYRWPLATLGSMTDESEAHPGGDGR
jgi:hypothetical protein